MILRKITRNRDSKTVHLPAAMVRELGWNFGDYLGIDLVGNDTIVLRRVRQEKLTDEQIRTAEPERVISHG